MHHINITSALPQPTTSWLPLRQCTILTSPLPFIFTVSYLPECQIPHINLVVTGRRPNPKLEAVNVCASPITKSIKLVCITNHQKYITECMHTSPITKSIKLKDACITNHQSIKLLCPWPHTVCSVPAVGLPSLLWPLPVCATYFSLTTHCTDSALSLAHTMCSVPAMGVSFLL